MDLLPVITGLVIITTAIFGFSQYFYSRIVAKNINLSAKLHNTTNILKEFPPKDNSDKKSELFHQFYADEIEEKNQKLDYLRKEIDQNKKKKTLISIIYRLAPFYVFYLITYSLTLFIHLKTYSTIIETIIIVVLGVISIILSILILKILFLVKKINVRQRGIKEEIKDISSQLRGFLKNWNFLEDVVVGEINKSNPHNFTDQEQNNIIQKEKYTKLQKILSNTNNNIPKELLDQILKIIQNYFK